MRTAGRRGGRVSARGQHFDGRLWCLPEETKQVLRLSLTEFSLPKFYLLFGISKVKSAAVIAFRSSYRDRSFSPGSYERETFALSSLETVTEALLEIMEVSAGLIGWTCVSVGS